MPRLTGLVLSSFETAVEYIMSNDNVINCTKTPNALISMKGYLTEGVTFTSSVENPEIQ